MTQDELCLSGQSLQLRELVMHHVRDMQLADAHLLHVLWAIVELTRSMAKIAESPSFGDHSLLPCLVRAHDIILMGRTAHERLVERLSEVVLAARTGLWGTPPQPPGFFTDISLKPVGISTKAIKDRSTRFGTQAGPATLASFVQSLSSRARPDNHKRQMGGNKHHPMSKRIRGGRGKGQDFPGDMGPAHLK